ncbi:exonuclease mut-7 homolog isoform X3 [Anolis carolinensis]|uniref:exonuclease mut-7 homolog isoform X3 n=1 Tax=Anolis carolinensis TaxID=28377 RepID=UPI002F2B3EE5
MLEASGSQDREPKPLLQSLQSVWETRNMNKLKQEMEVGFSALDDPWTWLLEALEVCGGWRGKGPSLGALLVKGLQQWCTKHPEGQPSGLKLRKLQARLFPLLAECHANLLDPLIGIYHLHAADRDFLLGHVNHLYHKGKFKEAAVLGIKLELQPDLELEKMCVPLLFQERMDLVEAFVESHPDLQQQLLLLLDTWFAPDFQITDVARKFPCLKPEKVNHRLLNRTVFRFLDKFQLDPALCPNVVNQRHLSTLKYLIYKRFREKTMTEENWTDHVQVTVQGNRWLQEQLVHLLVHHGGLQAAARWGLHYGLPKESLPRSVPEEMERLRQQESREDAPEPARSPGEGRRKAQCYGLPLPREQILFLSTWEALQEHKECLLKGSPGDLQKVDAERSEVRGRRARGLAERGLSLLVQEVLGSPLDKAEQLSDWEKRPLREEQLLYAASDAYCLLEVYAKLLEDPASFGLSPETLAFLMGRTESAEVQQPGGQSAAAGDSPRQEEEEEEDWDPTSVGTPSIPTPVVTPVQDFRVVCDNMLQGLGRHLRCLGVDVRILENADDHRKAAEIARQEGRVILTSGLPYQTLRSQVGEGRCFRVDCAQRAKEQALQVLEHFRVQVTLADIFSRCQACNCNQYLKVSRETMAHLVKVRSHPTGEEGAAPESSPPPATDPGRSTEGPGEGGGPPRLPNGLQLQIEALPPGVLTQEELSCFYCCKSCGKVFWEGSHFGRVVAQLRGALDLPESGGRLYGAPV